MAHTRYALEWHLPPLNLTLAWLTKGMLLWNGTFHSKSYPRVAHKRYAILEWHPPLNLTLSVAHKRYATLE